MAPAADHGDEGQPAGADAGRSEPVDGPDRDGRADVVGFGEAGMYVALNNSNGTFQPQRLAINDFGYTAGGWRVEKHPRTLADLTGDGRADVVGFGDAGMYVALNNGNGTFQPLQLAIDNFGYSAGGWRVDKHPRFVAGRGAMGQ